MRFGMNYHLASLCIESYSGFTNYKSQQELKFLQLLQLKCNHFFIINKLVNNKILNYLIPKDLEWKITYASFNNGEKTSIYKNGLFLFGDAAFPLPPHTAQAGNQILEDAVYIKKLLNENYDFYEIVNMFVKERYLKKDMLAKKSKMVGEILKPKILQNI